MMPAGASIVTFAHNLVRTAAFAFTTTLALAGCRGTDPAGSATDTDVSSTSTTSDAPTTSTTTTGVPTTSDGTSSTTGDDSSSGDLPTTTNMSAGFITTDTTTTTGPGMPQPNGGACQSDADCESMNCYTIPLSRDGICSECNEDSDCVDAGTGISCSIMGQTGAVCTEGSLGNQCMSQDACMDGLICGPVIEGIPLPGLIPDTCGECGDSADCDGGTICSPVADLMALSGAKECVEPGSVENGALCPLGEDDADAACASGMCDDVDVMGFLTLGMCGECKTDADCNGGTCVAGMIGMGGAAGSTCQ